jgi:diadenosine tetraphosphatase ApaH/serine/threonine PP2A family protein phosphatase
MPELNGKGSGRIGPDRILELSGGDLEGGLALLGGPYNNHHALRAALEDASRRGASRIFCLGDLGGFGPSPGKIYPLLEEFQVLTLAGNYDRALAERHADCGCGYTHPADNAFAQLSYDYTNRRTTDRERAWLGALPSGVRFRRAGRRYLLCHGSPRRINEFLWDSASSDGFLMRLARDAEADQVFCTHTGIPWQRTLPNKARFVNVGAIGRPANDGHPSVWYAFLPPGTHEAELVQVGYDHEALAREMEEERLPREFIETIRSGWWTTCLEILPAKERGRGTF